MIKITIQSILIILFLLIVGARPLPVLAETSAAAPIKIGWIGAMTGATAKWGAYKAAQLAVEEVNNSGGIKGRPLEVVYEDAHCSGTAAVSAFHKLTGADGLTFIIGGHCSPESLSFAALAERKKVISIAAITSSPKLTAMGDYIFRVTPVSTRLADLLVPYALEKMNLGRTAIIYELTDYVEPVAQRFSELFVNSGGVVSTEISFNPGETDFKSMLLKASQGNPDAIYLGVQAPDTALLLMKQIAELRLKQKIFGNEQFAGAFLAGSEGERKLLEGVIFAEPECDFEQSQTKSFAEKYRQRYQVKDLPFGCYTGESYDAIMILSAALRPCEENVDCVKKQLYALRNYQGASGVISFDANGDVDKKYLMKVIRQGRIEEIN